MTKPLTYPPLPSAGLSEVSTYVTCVVLAIACFTLGVVTYGSADTPLAQLCCGVLAVLGGAITGWHFNQLRRIDSEYLKKRDAILEENRLRQQRLITDMQAALDRRSVP